MLEGKALAYIHLQKILPKPLIPIGDIPISELIINQFREYGIKKIHMIVNEKKAMIKAYFF